MLHARCLVPGAGCPMPNAQCSSCNDLPATFLRDLTDHVWTFLGKDSVTSLSSIRVGAFACSASADQSKSVVADVEYRVSNIAGDDITLRLLHRAENMLAVRASGNTLLDDAVNADAANGIPKSAITGSAGVVASANNAPGLDGDASVCTATSDWTPWSDCSVAICSSSAGSQVRTRTCVSQADTQLCPAAECGDCNINNGGCSPNAECTLNADTLKTACSCDQAAFIGTGNACLDRAPAEQEMAGFDIGFLSSLSAVARTVQSQDALLNVLRRSAASAWSVPESRLVASSVRPSTESTFVYSVLVLPPTLPTDPTAAELEAKMSSSMDIFTQFRFDFDGMLLVPHSMGRSSAMYTDSSVAGSTPNNGASSSSSSTADAFDGSDNMTMVFDSSSASSALFDQQHHTVGSSRAGSGWTTKDSVSLLIVLCVVAVAVTVVFEVMRTQTKKKNRTLESEHRKLGTFRTGMLPMGNLVGGRRSLAVGSNYLDVKSTESNANSPSLPPPAVFFAEPYDSDHHQAHPEATPETQSSAAERHAAGLEVAPRSLSPWMDLISSGEMTKTAARRLANRSPAVGSSHDAYDNAEGLGLVGGSSVAANDDFEDNALNNAQAAITAGSDGGGKTTNVAMTIDELQAMQTMCSQQLQPSGTVPVAAASISGSAGASDSPAAGATNGEESPRALVQATHQNLSMQLDALAYSSTTSPGQPGNTGAE